MNQTEILRQERLKKAELEAKDKRHTELVSAVNNQTATTIKAFNAFTKYVDRKISKTEVVNQLKEIGTPDAMKVMSAVNDMHATLKKLKNTDFTPIAKLLEDLIGEVSQIPKESPEAVESVEINNLPDFDSYTTRIEQAVQALDVKPVVNVQAPQVTVKPADVHIEKQDFTTLEKALKQVVSAVENIVVPAQILTDVTGVEKKLDKSNDYLKKISEKSFGGGGSGGHTTPYQDDQARPSYVTLVDGKIPVSLTAGTDPSSFYVYDIEDGTTAYYGNTNVAGAWMVKKVTDTLVSYATVTNNVAVTTYTDAWTDKAILTYGRIDQAF